MKHFEYRIVVGKDLLTVSKDEFFNHIEEHAPCGYFFRRVGDITYYYSTYKGKCENKVIAERLVIN